MQIDKTLIKEIKKLNGDESRDAGFAMMALLKDAKRTLSRPEVIDVFDETVRIHGRAVVAVCVAATLYVRRERIGEWGLKWAKEVLASWTTKTPSRIEDVQIVDNLHPTKICAYAEDFMRLVTLDGEIS